MNYDAKYKQKWLESVIEAGMSGSSISRIEAVKVSPWKLFAIDRHPAKQTILRITTN